MGYGKIVLSHEILDNETFMDSFLDGLTNNKFRIESKKEDDEDTKKIIYILKGKCFLGKSPEGCPEYIATYSEDDSDLVFFDSRSVIEVELDSSFSEDFPEF